MLKSLTDIRVLMIFVMSVVLAFGAKLIDAGYTFFIAFIVAFTFCFGLMEISVLLVNKVSKKSFGNFLIFWLSFLVLGYFFCSALGFLLNFNALATVQIQICLSNLPRFGSIPLHFAKMATEFCTLDPDLQKTH